MVGSPRGGRQMRPACNQWSPADKICSCVSASQKSGKYKFYVLFVLVLTCLLSQLHRFVLIATNVSMAQELKFGDSRMIVPSAGSVNVSVKLLDDKNMTSTSYHNACSVSPQLCNINTSDNDLERVYLGTGMQYQVLAGPVFILVFAISSIPLGVLAEMHQINRSLVLSMLVILWSTVTIVCGLAQHYWQVAVSRMSLGIFVAGCNPFSASMISDYFKPNRRGIAMALYTLGIYVGFSSSFLLIMADRVIGWRCTYFSAGVVGVFVGTLILFTVREPERSQTAAKVKTRTEKKTLCNRDLLALCDPLFVLFCLTASIRFGGGYVWAYNLRNFFSHYHKDAKVELYMSWIPMVFGALGSVLGGAISDVLSRKHGFTARFLVLIFSQVITGPLQVGSLYLNPPWALLMQIPTCLAAEMWMGVAMVIIMDLVPTKLRALAISIFFFGGNVIGGNLSLLVPPLSKKFGLRVALFLTIPLCYWIAAFLFTVILLLLKYSVSKQEDKSKYQPQIYKCLDQSEEDIVNTTNAELKSELV